MKNGLLVEINKCANPTEFGAIFTVIHDLRVVTWDQSTHNIEINGPDLRVVTWDQSTHNIEINGHDIRVVTWDQITHNI